MHSSGLLKQHGKPLDWFRHPYLETGFPEPVKREIDDWLAAHGRWGASAQQSYPQFFQVCWAPDGAQ